MIITTTIGVSIVSVLITASGMFAAFMFRQGSQNNEIKNMRERQITEKIDLLAAIEKKADKDIVELILASIKTSIEQNQTEHRSIMEKIDRLIERER